MSCSMLLRTADFIGRVRTIPTCRLRKPLESSGSNLLMHLYLSVLDVASQEKKLDCEHKK